MIPKIIPWGEWENSDRSKRLDTSINDDLINLDWLKKELAECKKANYKGIFMENELALLIMDSAGEHLTPKDEVRIESLYQKYSEACDQKQSEAQIEAAQNKKETVNKRAKAIWLKNHDLNRIEHMEKRARIILSNWGNRGDGEYKPKTTRTIINWLKKFENATAILEKSPTRS